MSIFKKINFAWSMQSGKLVRFIGAMVIVLSNLGGSTAHAQGVADLALTKQADRHFVRVGQNVVYVITLTNLGPDVATDIEFGDSLPDQLNRVAFACSQGVPTRGTFCQVDRLEPGESVSALVVTTPIANIAWSERRVSNTAFIETASNFDPDGANNTASAIVIAIR